MVVDMHNPISSPTITIIPLSSIKDNKKIHHNDVYLGTQIYDALFTKLKKYKNDCSDTITDISVQNEIEKIKLELKRMKKGSFAIVNQITTISKMRIYDPKYPKDILNGIRLSCENLDLINEKLKKLYVK